VVERVLMIITSRLVSFSMMHLDAMTDFAAEASDFALSMAALRRECRASGRWRREERGTWRNHAKILGVNLC